MLNLKTKSCANNIVTGDLKQLDISLKKADYARRFSEEDKGTTSLSYTKLSFPISYFNWNT
jgi:hypothetical protein